MHVKRNKPPRTDSIPRHFGNLYKHIVEAHEIASQIINFLLNKLRKRQDKDLPTGRPAYETPVLITPLVDSTLLDIHVIALTNTALF